MSVSKIYMIGQVISRGIGRTDAVKVKCLNMKLNTYLYKYFNKAVNVWAIEDEVQCKLGDVVLLKKMPHSITPRARHIISEVLYPAGYVTDPLTGRRIRGIDYIDEAQREMEEKFIEEEKKNMDKLNV